MTDSQRYGRLRRSMSKYTIAYGNAFDGLTFYGVFDDFDEAEEYAATHGEFGFYIVELQDKDNA
jgi:hypothetical protein